MLKRIPAPRAEELVAEAATVPTSDPRVSYPAWYLHRWHFLPEGYLSRRSAAWYEHIVRNVYNQGLERRTVRAVVEHLRKINPTSLLEVGCGPGRMLAATVRSGVATDRVGLDLSPYLLERARRKLRGNVARLVHGNGLAIPSEECAFDAALSCHYVGHLPDAIRGSAVAELTRVLRPGGHLFVVDHRWHAFPGNDALRLVHSSSRNLGMIRLSIFERLDSPALVPA
ncbi:MAG: class I SAM-dependent methyltransferase [bacterium]